jgi:GntR family transcriptional regulator
MPVPDFSDPRPVYLQIADDLRLRIRAGEPRHRPGDRLPSNRELSDRYGVATETLRQSLAVLHREGLVATQSTRGTFVLKEPSEQTGGDAPSAARMAAIEEELATLRRRVARLHAELMELYASTGRVYPYGDGEEWDGTSNPGRQVG